MIKWYNWAQKLIHRHQEDQETGQYQDQKQSFPMFTPQCHNSIQTKGTETKELQRRENDPDRQEPLLQSRRRVTQVQVWGPTPSSNHNQEDHQATCKRGAKAPYAKTHTKLLGKSCQHLVQPKGPGQRQGN